MASKLDYLKKYMAKPGKASDTTGSLYSSAGGGAGKVKSGKDKARRKAQEQASMQIRDMSEALPKPRAEGRKGALGAQRRGDLGMGGALAAEPEDGLVFVDKEEVEQKSKLNHETSGVAWKISQHRKGKPPGHRGVAARVAADSGGGDGDLSPPRRSSGGAGAAAVAAAVAASAPASAAAKAEDSDEDLSLPRASKKDAKEVKAEPAASDDDLSLPRPDKKSVKPEPGESDDDLSLPRPDKAASTSKKSAAAPRPAAGGGGDGGSDSDDLSLPRKPEAPAAASKRPSGRHDSDSDLSPPRGRAAAKEVKKEAAGSDDDDLSPPRRDGGSAKAVSSGAKQPRPSGRHDSDSDLSPPRGRASGKDVKKEKCDSDDDFSPPRRDAGSGKAASSTAKATGGVGGAGRHDSDSDDLSPPRKGGGGEEEEEPEKMSSGLRAGLVRGSVLKEEAAQVRAERRAAMLAQSDEQTGRNATTVYRNKQGAKIDREEWVDQQQKKRRKKLSDYPEQELEWGGGVKQQFRKEAEMEELERIAAQPFARYEPDEKYIEELKGKKDWNDPMRKFQDDDEDDDKEEDKRASGAGAGAGGDVGAAVAAAARKAPKPKCPHAPWPNRFDIPPGYRWDGKVRGSGYEKKWLETKNHRQCVDKERWKWEMEEM